MTGTGGGINVSRSGGGIDDAAQIQQAVIPTTTLADGEFISFRLNVPADKKLVIWAVGIQNNSNNAPGGLTAEVDNESTATNVVSENQKRITGDPLAEVAGAADVAMRAENDTGNSQNASATFSYTIVDQ